MATERMTAGAVSATRKPAPQPAKRESAKPKKLSYKDQRELHGIEALVLDAEALVAALEAESKDPTVTADHVRLTAIFTKLDAAQRDVERLYARWQELELMANGGAS